MIKYFRNLDFLINYILMFNLENFVESSIVILNVIVVFILMDIGLFNIFFYKVVYFYI